MFEVTTKVQVTHQMIADLVVTAFEGGSNYWIERVDYLLVPKGFEFEKPTYSDPRFYELGGVINIRDNEDSKSWVLDRDTIAKGLQLMADKYHATHWRDLVDDNHDAETADVFLQLCLFGEVVYG